MQASDKRRSIESIIQERGRPEAVFITAMSANFPTAVFKSIILNYGNIPVIIGGIHVSSSPGDVDALIRPQCPHPDLIAQVIGAGDTCVIQEILIDLKNGNLKPEYHGHNSIEDLVWKPSFNEVELPQMRLNALKRIPLCGAFFARRLRVRPFAPFLGCPYACKFCSISSVPKKNRKFTIRSTTDILNELEAYQKDGNFESRFFFFLPDNLLLGGQYLHQIMDGIIERKLKINFAAQISIEIASNPALLDKLRQAGATHFFIGFESLDIRNLEAIGKHIVPHIKASGLSVAEYYQHHIRTIQRYGISIHGAFIVGLPHDYFKSFENNTAKDMVQFCIKNHIGIQPATLTDLPGSIFFKESQAQGNFMYGTQGSMEYLLALCLADLSETNRKITPQLPDSALTLLYMSFQSVRDVGAARYALKNGFYMSLKSFLHPTQRGRTSFKERLLDALFSFALQLYVALYKDVGEIMAASAGGVRGSFERLYAQEKNIQIKSYFKTYVDQFREKERNDV